MLSVFICENIQRQNCGIDFSKLCAMYRVGSKEEQAKFGSKSVKIVVRVKTKK